MSQTTFGLDHWPHLIKSYSARQMTYETDTFPAISGITQKIQQLTGDMYYAGLWKQRFLDGLLWRPAIELGSQARMEGHPQAPRRRHEWIAPSWSWASVKGKITHPLWDSKHFEYCACLEECSVTYHGTDPLGALKEGFARLSRPVTLVTEVQAEGELPLGYNSSCMIQLSNGTWTEGSVYFDFVHHMPCDVLMITPDWGICIEKVEHITNTYVRIGVVQIWPMRHTSDSVAYNLECRRFPATRRDPSLPITSDHVSPRTIILI